jgi:hypothetical protein
MATEPEQYTSMFGLPVIGLPDSGSGLAVTFTMQVLYMSLVFRQWETFAQSDKRLDNYRQSKTCDTFHHNANDSQISDMPNMNQTLFLDGDMPKATLRNISGVVRNTRIRQLYFVSRYRKTPTTEFTLSATKCNVTEPHVEALVSCPTGRDCRVTKICRSTVDMRPETTTPLDSVFRREVVLRILPILNGGTTAEVSSKVENFLRDSTATARLTDAELFIRLSDVAPPVFSRRLTILLNDMYMLSRVNHGQILVGNTLPNLSAYDFDFGKLPSNGSIAAAEINRSCRLTCTQATAATLTHAVEVFACNRAWLILLFVCSGVLLATHVAGTLVGRRTRMPDILGYVASMTYNNRYLPLPKHGGALDAMHQARILCDLPIFVDDVRGEDDVGRIAFINDSAVRTLEYGREYV